MYTKPRSRKPHAPFLAVGVEYSELDLFVPMIDRRVEVVFAQWIAQRAGLDELVAHVADHERRLAHACANTR